MFLLQEHKETSENMLLLLLDWIYLVCSLSITFIMFKSLISPFRN